MISSPWRCIRSHRFLSRLDTRDLVLFVPEVGKSQISLLPEADGIEPTRGNASHESAWGKSSAIECRPNPKFREARFPTAKPSAWITVAVGTTMDRTGLGNGSPFATRARSVMKRVFMGAVT